MSHEQFVSVAEAAKLVGRSRVTLYRDYVNTGKLSVLVNDVTGKKQVAVSELMRVFGPLKPVLAVNVTDLKQSKPLQEETVDELMLLRHQVATLTVKLEMKEDQLRKQEANMEKLVQCVVALGYRPAEEKPVVVPEPVAAPVVEPVVVPKRAWWRFGR